MPNWRLASVTFGAYGTDQSSSMLWYNSVYPFCFARIPFSALGSSDCIVEVNYFSISWTMVDLKRPLKALAILLIKLPLIEMDIWLLGMCTEMPVAVKPGTVFPLEMVWLVKPMLTATLTWDIDTSTLPLALMKDHLYSKWLDLKPAPRSFTANLTPFPAESVVIWTFFDACEMWKVLSWMYPPWKLMSGMLTFYRMFIT